MIKAIKGFKTFIASACVSLAGTIAALPTQLQQLGLDWKSVIPQVVSVKLVGFVLLGLGLLFGLLRYVTDTPPFQTYPTAAPLPPPGPPPQYQQYAPGPIPPEQLAPPIP